MSLTESLIFNSVLAGALLVVGLLDKLIFANNDWSNIEDPLLGLNIFESKSIAADSSSLDVLYTFNSSDWSAINTTSAPQDTDAILIQNRCQ